MIIMKVNDKKLQAGDEQNYGTWGFNGSEFSLSLRWKQDKSVYEFYKVYMASGREETLFTDKNLPNAIIKALGLINRMARVISEETSASFSKT
jgi:hypothetical protein